jgi:hypothetical protein
VSSRPRRVKSGSFSAIPPSSEDQVPQPHPPRSTSNPTRFLSFTHASLPPFQPLLSPHLRLHLLLLVRRAPSTGCEAMGQQSLIYAFVARGTVVLAEYTEFTGNFTTIAAQCLQKLPASNNKFTYNCDGHTFNYLVEDGFSE